MSRRVVITGAGYVSGLGVGREALFSAMREGRSGVRSILGTFDGITMTHAAPVKDFTAEDHFDPARIKQQLDPLSQYAVVAAREAVASSGLDLSDEVRETTSAVLGSSIGGLDTVEENFVLGPKRVHPMAIPRMMASAPASQVAMEFGLHGPSFATSSACSSSAHAIAQAVLFIRAGLAERAVTGGTESTHVRSSYRSWDALRVVSRDACRPFCKSRSGIVLGEGAGVYVLEEYEAAKARGANILAEIIGIGMTSDGSDILAPNQRWVEKAIERCLKDAQLNPQDVHYINAHGTGTKLNDVCETEAIKKVFNGQTKQLAVSSTKPIHGHTLGAAAGIEISSILLAMNEGVIAPTLNYNEQDPECDLDYVTNAPRDGKVDVALCNSFAFGGLNAVLAFKKV
ncbi:beta-ketoacyl-[acyl-carrier-protein] synthase family protein [Terasakiella pusilla]|uniref:beta-ketoacyl-[acyl-carrier-protein] synthase family protein n=1 Tax=Terasakiella pusilla TaxID=64973 RepID=UPI003AA85169